MRRLVFAARGEGTYDVYHKARLVGSVWSYGDVGWVAFTPCLWMVDGPFETRTAAALRLVQQ